jgi:hypothetical protein
VKLAEVSLATASLVPRWNISVTHYCNFEPWVVALFSQSLNAFPTGRAAVKAGTAATN